MYAQNVEQVYMLLIESEVLLGEISKKYIEIINSFEVLQLNIGNKYVEHLQEQHKQLKDKILLQLLLRQMSCENVNSVDIHQDLISIWLFYNVNF